MPLEHPETNFSVTGTVRECRNIPQIIHKVFQHKTRPCNSYFKQKPKVAKLYEVCYRETDTFVQKYFYDYIFLSDNERNLFLVPTYTQMGRSREKRAKINEGSSQLRDRLYSLTLRAQKCTGQFKHLLHDNISLKCLYFQHFI